MKETKTFKGRPLVKGTTRGEAVVSRQGFNALAVYRDAAIKGGKHAYASDQSNPDIFGKQIDDRILVMPQVVGSTTAGMVNATAALLGYQPRAYLFSNSIDTLAAAGALFTKSWIGKKVIYIDRLGQEFLDHVRNGMTIFVKEDGSVIVTEA